MKRNLLIGFIVFLFLNLLFPAVVYAAPIPQNLIPRQPNWVDSGYAEAFKDCTTNNGVNSFCYTSHVEVGRIINEIRLIVGAVKGMTIGMNETDEQYIAQMNDGSAIGGMSKVMAFMISNPPADLALWIRDTGQTLGFIPKQANAQGIGFSGMAPLLPIWKGFRNIAYFLLALVMIMVGFMVMFRKKIDPKTVVTVQNALPRIVITLILITFSYAIVGFMIDLMYLVIALGIAILSTGFQGTTISVFNIQADLMNGGLLTLIGAVFAPIINFNPIVQGVGNILSLDIVNAIKNIGAGLLINLMGVGPLFMLLLSLGYLFAFVRILIMLLSAYIQILLAVMTGPIQILLDAFPGGNGFSGWIKNLLINLVPFPITIFMLILGNTLINNTQSGTLWQPPLLPQIAGGIGGLSEAIIWLGLILVIPQIVNGIKEALKTKPFIPVGAVTAPLTEAFQTGTGAMSLFYYGAQIKQMFPKGDNKTK